MSPGRAKTGRGFSVEDFDISLLLVGGKGKGVGVCSDDVQTDEFDKVKAKTLDKDASRPCPYKDFRLADSHALVVQSSSQEGPSSPKVKSKLDVMLPWSSTYRLQPRHSPYPNVGVELSLDSLLPAAKGFTPPADLWSSFRPGVASMAEVWEWVDVEKEKEKEKELEQEKLEKAKEQEITVKEPGVEQIEKEKGQMNTEEEKGQKGYHGLKRKRDMIERVCRSSTEASRTSLSGPRTCRSGSS